MSWIQKGTTFIGGAGGDNLGYQVALSADGKILAFGVSGATTVNGTDSGLVRVYECVDNSWVQRGSDILGLSDNERFGRAVSLSNDGSTLAVGAPTANTNIGLVRTYQWDGSNYVRTDDGLALTGGFSGDDYGSHSLEIVVDNPGLRIYSLQFS